MELGSCESKESLSFSKEDRTENLERFWGSLINTVTDQPFSLSPVKGGCTGGVGTQGQE